MQRGSRFVQALVMLMFAGGSFSDRGQTRIDELPLNLDVPHNRGDSVQPVFDGWQRYPDGHVGMWFGYYNRNLKEQVDLPVGSANSFNTSPDQGQPTHFYTGRHQYVFKVDLPKDWSQDKKLIWTLTAYGDACTAIGWLQREWEVDNGVRQMNAGAGLAPPDNNTAPTITSGSPDQSVQMGTPLKLSVSATDDGIPKNGRGGGGVRVNWILYRGPGPVTFKPSQSSPVYGKPIESTTEAAFAAPGTYWLQAIASDGLLATVHNIKVVVTK